MYIRCLPCGVLQSRKLLRSHVSHPLTSETSGLTSVIPVMMLGLIELIINNSTTQWTCKNAGITLSLVSKPRHYSAAVNRRRNRR